MACLDREGSLCTLFWVPLFPKYPNTYRKPLRCFPTEYWFFAFPATKFTNILPAFLTMYSKAIKRLQSKTPENTEIHRNHFCQLLLGPLLWEILSIRTWCVQLKRSFCAKPGLAEFCVEDGGGGTVLVKKACIEKPASDLKYLVRLCKTERQLTMKLKCLGDRPAVLPCLYMAALFESRGTAAVNFPLPFLLLQVKELVEVTVDVHRLGAGILGKSLVNCTVASRVV